MWACSFWGCRGRESWKAVLSAQPWKCKQIWTTNACCRYDQTCGCMMLFILAMWHARRKQGPSLQQFPSGRRSVLHSTELNACWQPSMTTLTDRPDELNEQNSIHHTGLSKDISFYSFQTRRSAFSFFQINYDIPIMASGSWKCS